MRTLRDQRRLYEENWKNNVPLFGTQIFRDDPISLYWIGFRLPMTLGTAISQESDALKLSQFSTAHTWLKPDQLHITVDMPERLGTHYQEKDMQDLVPFLQEACRGLKPFQLEIGSYNCFPAVLFREVYDASGMLFELHRRIASIITWSEQEQFRNESYLPHVSLCYLKEPAETLLADMQSTKNVTSVECMIDTLSFTIWYTAINGQYCIEPLVDITLGAGNISSFSSPYAPVTRSI